MLSYRVTLDVPLQLAVFVSRLLAGHRRELGTRNGTRARLLEAGSSRWPGSGTGRTSGGWARASGSRRPRIPVQGRGRRRARRNGADAPRGPGKGR